MDDRICDFIFENSETWNKSFYRFRSQLLIGNKIKVDDSYLKSEV